jgi:hypothetical protein
LYTQHVHAVPNPAACLSLQAETHSDSPTPEDFASLCAAINARQFPQLLQLDQLKLEQAAGHVFAGFTEGEIDFAPTFKVCVMKLEVCLNG